MNLLFGDIVKVTPSSKVVGDMAMFLVKNNLDVADVFTKADELSFPESVVGFFKGMIGQPYQGFPAEAPAYHPERGGADYLPPG